MSMLEILQEKGYTVSTFATAAQAADYLDSVIDGVSVGIGGSMTVEQMGLYDRLQSHNTVHWHWKGGDLTQAAVADVYLTSVNALSENGEIINIDGIGNRVASMFYGHKKVYLLVGKNKIAPDFESALHRARNIAAPLNAKRLNKATPCVKGGRCFDCRSPERICCELAVLWQCPMQANIEIVLIDQALGY